MLLSFTLLTFTLDYSSYINVNIIYSAQNAGL